MEIDKQDFITCFGGEHGARMIAHLKEKFAVNLPVFQHKESTLPQKHHDPMIDAAIRDGNHEVIQYILSETNQSYDT